MKRILIFEYITGGGLIENKLDHHLLTEANIILRSLINTTKYQISFFCDYRHKYVSRKGAIIVNQNNSKIIYDGEFINQYDYFIPVCPEVDFISYNYIKKIAPKIENLYLSDLRTILITTDKIRLKKICTDNNILNPDTYDSNVKDTVFITKDRYGCGCSDTYFVKKGKHDDSNNITEKYIPGNSHSVNLHVSENSYRVLSINKHNMTVSKGRIQVKSILVNLYPTNKNLIFKFIDDVISILPNLRGFVGIDFIEYKGEFFLIEVNPRYTTSMSMLQKCKNTCSLDYIEDTICDIAGKTCQLNLI